MNQFIGDLALLQVTMPGSPGVMGFYNLQEDFEMKKGLKLSILAVMFSAAFFVGTCPAGAYTYNGGNTTIDKVAEDENEFVVTGGANVISNNEIHPSKIKITKENVDNIITLTTRTYAGTSVHDDNSDDVTISGLPDGIPQSVADEILKELNEIGSTDGTYYLTDINTKYNLNVWTSFSWSPDGGDGPRLTSPSDLIKSGNLKYDGKKWVGDDYDWGGSSDSDSWGFTKYTDTVNFKNGTKTITSTENHGDASITVSNNSTLTGKGNVQTSKAINVISTSKLITATGTITGGTITSDGDIIAQANYSAPSGKSTITAASVVSNGALTAAKDIKATTGNISGTVIQATSGNIVANNTIKATGKVKGNALNVGVINASSASITGDQSISGIFTTNGQAKLNGGAALGGKKITGLAAGTLSTTSTEAVNGSQLNTIKEKLATAGKSYTAGSDIAISSANAISVSKTGTVKAGDTGIVTGADVYAETNSLNTKLNGLVDLVNSHQTKIASLQQQMRDLNQTITNINSQVAAATGNLTNQLSKCLKTDMGNLTDAGKTAIRNIVSSSLKSMGNQSSHAVSSVNESSIATFEAPSTHAESDTVSSKDISDIHASIADKVDKAALESVKPSVNANAKQIGSNAELIHSNTSAISSLKANKADIDGSNIDVEKYEEKLGAGTVEKDNTGLVSGDSVYSALDKKADIGYMDAGMGMAESRMQSIQQQASRDMNRVGAGASALAGLHPTAFDAADKLSFATGYGHYKNANISALGAFYHPNEKTMVSLAGTIGNKDAMLSAGVSIKVGMGDKVSKVMMTPKMFSTQEVINQKMKDRMDTQSERIHQIELALQHK